MKVLLAVLGSCLLAFEAAALSSGAPSSACADMAPRHGGEAQPLPAPFTVTASAIDSTRYQVNIEADSGVTFKGFFIQARSNLTNTAIGTFDTSDESQSIECFSLPLSSATHISKAEKTLVSVVWNAPQPAEDFFLVASIVQQFNTYWVQLPAVWV